jgi:hypothetical protein
MELWGRGLNEANIRLGQNPFGFAPLAGRP